MAGLNMPTGPRLVLLQEQATQIRGHTETTPAPIWPAKDPADTVDLGADFRLLTGGLELETLSVTADGCVVVANEVSGTVAVVRLSGGVVNCPALVFLTGAFGGGEVRNVVVLLPILAQSRAAGVPSVPVSVGSQPVSLFRSPIDLSRVGAPSDGLQPGDLVLLYRPGAPARVFLFPASGLGGQATGGMTPASLAALLASLPTTRPDTAGLAWLDGQTLALS